MTIKWPFPEENRLDLSEETYNRLSHDAEMNRVVSTADDEVDWVRVILTPCVEESGLWERF